MSSGTKRCTGCGQARPLEYFKRDAARADGRRSRCKGCTGVPLPEDIRSRTGLSPSVRARLDAAAKAQAMRFTWAVKARNAAEVERICSAMSWHDLAATAIVLAEAVQPGSMRLLEVTRIADNGMPEGDADAAA